MVPHSSHQGCCCSGRCIYCRDEALIWTEEEFTLHLCWIALNVSTLSLQVLSDRWGKNGRELSQSLWAWQVILIWNWLQTRRDEAYQQLNLTEWNSEPIGLLFYSQAESSERRHGKLQMQLITYVHIYSVHLGGATLQLCASNSKTPYLIFLMGFQEKIPRHKHMFPQRLYMRNIFNAGRISSHYKWQLKAILLMD